MRAVRYSSTLSAFNEEQHTIELTLLYNGLLLPTDIFHNLFFHLSPKGICQDTSTIDS